jgi:predicted esterase YcpF (UPF0227 family)
MKKIAVYFHGYNSSANSNKVEQLREAGFETYSWDIDIDPNISIPFLDNKIMDVLLDNINEEMDLVFIGTSLGAWYAAKLAEHFINVRTILINPSHDPKNSLLKYGVPESLCEEYTPIVFNENHEIYIGSEDNVIDFSSVVFSPAKTYLVEGADHRFKEHFNIVIKNI